MGEMCMRIAVTSDGKNVSSHFGKTIKFVIFEIFKGKTRGRLLIDVSASGGHDALTYILKNESVEVLLCGEITEDMKVELENQGIEVISGLKGNISGVLRGYMRRQTRGD